MNQSAEKIGTSYLDDAYELLSQIGRGGNSVVYKARVLPKPSDSISRTQFVALKIFNNTEKKPAEAIDRVRREALALLGSRNPHVIRVHDYVANEQCCYLAMEFAAFGDLKSLIESRKEPLSADAVLRLAAQLYSGIDAIHRAGLIHCDIKPENLLLADAATLKISDFGIAVLPAERQLIENGAAAGGTLDYAAPEFLEHNIVNQDTDLYAAAVTMFQMLTGSLPFEGKTIHEKVNRKIAGNRQALATFVTYDTRALENFFNQALSPDPRNRFASAAACLKAIEELRQQLLSPALTIKAAKEAAAPAVQPSAAPRLSAGKPTHYTRHRPTSKIKTPWSSRAPFVIYALSALMVILGASAVLHSDEAIASLHRQSPEHALKAQKLSLLQSLKTVLGVKSSVFEQAKVLTKGVHTGELENLFEDGQNVPLVTKSTGGSDRFALALLVPGWKVQTIFLSRASASNEIRILANGMKLSLWIDSNEMAAAGAIGGHFREHQSGREGRWQLNTKTVLE